MERKDDMRTFKIYKSRTAVDLAMGERILLSIVDDEEPFTKLDKKIAELSKLYTHLDVEEASK